MNKWRRLSFHHGSTHRPSVASITWNWLQILAFFGFVLLIWHIWVVHHFVVWHVTGVELLKSGVAGRNTGSGWGFSSSSAAGHISIDQRWDVVMMMCLLGSEDGIVVVVHLWGVCHRRCRTGITCIWVQQHWWHRATSDRWLKGDGTHSNLVVLFRVR